MSKRDWLLLAAIAVASGALTKAVLLLVSP